MNFEKFEYTIGNHFIIAIEYGDTTGLTDSEEKQLDNFLSTLLPGHWAWTDENLEFARDDISGLYGHYLIPA